MKLIWLLSWLTILLVACGKTSKSELRFFEKKFSQVSPLINTHPAGTPDPLLEKVIYNDEYPLEIMLYSDKTFHYNLPKLGEGKGTWKYEGGELVLLAKHFIERLDFEFDMEYTIAPLDAEGKRLEIRFRDRFGAKNFELAKRNID